MGDAALMRVTMMLADHAQVADGKLFISGGGWSYSGPGHTPCAVAVIFHVLDPSDHHHVPVLLSPFGYSTYRGT